MGSLGRSRGDGANPLRAFRAGYWFGGFNGLTWMIGLGTPMVLLTEQLGGSALQVGLASSFVTLLYPIQVVATALLPRFGFRRQMVLAWLARAVFLLVPMSLAWLAPAEPANWMPSAVVLAVLGFCVCRAFGVAAHIPWMAAILPDEARGRFFATDNAITSAVGVVALFSCAALFERLAPYDAFRAVYGVALVGSTLAVVNLLRLPQGPEPPASPMASMLRDAVTLSLRPGLFRLYLAISLLWLGAIMPIPAFAAFYLKSEAGVSSSVILAYTGVQFVGQIAGATSIRRLLDRLPIRRFFQAGSLVIIAVCLVWLELLVGDGQWQNILWLAYLLVGLAVGLSQAAHFTYLPELAPPDKRPVTIAIFGAVSGMLAGLAPVLLGFLLRTQDGAGIRLDRFVAFFCVAIGMSLLGIFKLQALPDTRSGVGGQQ